MVSSQLHVSWATTGSGVSAKSNNLECVEGWSFISVQARHQEPFNTLAYGPHMSIEPGCGALPFRVSYDPTCFVPHHSPAVTVPAQSSRIKARAAEAAQCKQIPETSSNKQVKIDLVSSDVEKASPSSSKTAGGPAKSDPGTDVSASTAEVDVNGVAAATRSRMHKDGHEEGSPGPTEEGFAEGKEGKTSHLAAVSVCVAGAVMSSMLQFAFVYGEVYFRRCCYASAQQNCFL